jgi:hypothetical protein
LVAPATDRVLVLGGFADEAARRTNMVASMSIWFCSFVVTSEARVVTRRNLEGD